MLVRLYYQSSTDLTIEIHNLSGATITNVIAKVNEDLVEFDEIHHEDSAVATGFTGRPTGFVSLQWTENGSARYAFTQIIGSSRGPQNARLVIRVVDPKVILASLK